MDKNFMNDYYVCYDEKIGVLCADERKVVKHILGTDLTIVHDMQEGRTYLLVPLTRNHKFECKGDYIIVDGKRFDSDYYFRKDACQWIEMQPKDILAMIA